MFFILILICLWIFSFTINENIFNIGADLLSTNFGKFIAIGLCWTFSFHILNELRHLFWDLGYGFDLKISKITGALALVGSFILTIVFYLIGNNFI